MSMKSVLFTCRSVRRFSSVVRTVPESSAVLVEAHAGARVLNLNRSSSGNILNKDVTSSLSTRLRSYEDNEGVGLVMFASDSRDTFSAGLDGKQTLDDLKALNAFTKQLSDYSKGTAVVFEGQVSDSGLSTFLGSKYRLGTESTRFSIKSLQQGRLPLGGGLAYRLSVGKKEGVAMSRYLAATGVEISAFDLYELGYLTHVVPESPQAILVNALGDTFADSESKAYQPRTDTENIAPLLDTMHYELAQLPGVFTNAIWGKFLSVAPTTVLEQTKEDTSKSLADLKEAVQFCFGSDSVEDCMKKLEIMVHDRKSSTHQWAVETLAAVQKVDRELLQTWFKITRQSNKKSFSACLKLEEELLAVV